MKFRLRWYVMSLTDAAAIQAVRKRTSISTSARSRHPRGLASYCEAVIDFAADAGKLLDRRLLPQEMDTSSALDALISSSIRRRKPNLATSSFLSRDHHDITVRDLLLNRSDVHHVYPRNHLKKQGLTRWRYNQIANFVLAQSEINIGIGDKAPEVYFAELAEQCNSGLKKYGGITEPEEMRANLRMSCLPAQRPPGAMTS